MIRIIKKFTAETTNKPSYCSCPYCKGQIVFFLSNPVMCSHCTQPLETRYLDLSESVEYRLRYHFKKKE